MDEDIQEATTDLAPGPALIDKCHAGDEDPDQAESTSTAVAVVESEPERKPLEGMRLPTFAILAALSVLPIDAATGKKKNPYPFVHIYGTGDIVRVAATNGHRAFIFGWHTKAPPAWLEKGLNLSPDGLADRIKLIDKVAPANPSGEPVVDIAWADDAPYASMFDPAETVTFRLFPDMTVEWPTAMIQKIIDGLKFGAKQTIDLHSTAFAAGYVKGAAAMAATLGSKTIRMFGTALGENEPVLFDFPGCPGAILVLLPFKDDQQMAPMTARLLEAPVAGTVAALRAHRTRWEQKLPKAAGDRAKRTIHAKIEEYDQRIDAILGRTRTALPAPPTPPEVDREDQVLDAPESFDEHAAPGPIAFVPKPAAPTIAQAEAEAKSVELLAGQRARLKGTALGKAMVRFHADINAALSKAHDGLTLNELEDGVPLDSWFIAGLDAKAAAQRCLSWQKDPARVTASVIPDPNKEEPQEEAAE